MAIPSPSPGYLSFANIRFEEISERIGSKQQCARTDDAIRPLPEFE
jgi:hypothetical protein